MNTFSRLGPSFVVLILLGAGCAPAGTPGSPASPTARGGNCDNPYYPLREGHQITYKTQTAGHAGTMTMKVTGVSASGATVTNDFGGVVSTQQVRCVGGTLEATGTLDTSGTGVAVTGRSETRSSSGTFIPQDLSAGKIWDSAAQTAVTMTLPAAAARVNGGSTTLEVVTDTTTHNEALAEESITVPAGTYRAIKVKSTITATSQGGLPGMDATHTTVTNEWFVRDVGLVKTVNEDGTSTMEATSVTP